MLHTLSRIVIHIIKCRVKCYYFLPFFCFFVFLFLEILKKFIFNIKRVFILFIIKSSKILILVALMMLITKCCYIYIFICQNTAFNIVLYNLMILHEYNNIIIWNTSHCKLWIHKDVVCVSSFIYSYIPMYFSIYLYKESYQK